MTKKNFKKIIFIVLFITFLVVFFLFVKNHTSNDNEITFVKKIISEKYDELIYIDENNYLIGINNEDDVYEYNIYDYNGNKLYSFEDNKLLNIVSAKKKYFIVKDSKYVLYDNDYEFIRDGEDIRALSEYLVYSDNKIINLDNEVVFDNVSDYSSYNNNKLFFINNKYIVDKKGEIILEDYIIDKEVYDENKLAYLILKKDSKYYTFFTGLEKILGEGFDYYYIDDNLYTINNYSKYKIYYNGLRKKVEEYNVSNKIKNKYTIKSKNIISKKYAFVNNSNSFGLLNLKNGKFNKISDNQNFEIISKNKDNSLFLIKNDNIRMIYDLKNKSIKYSTLDDIDELYYFRNGYKEIKKGEEYTLYSKDNKEVLKSNLQIIINNVSLEIGSVKDNVVLYNLKNEEMFEAKKIIINNEIYYEYTDGNNYFVQNKDNKYSSTKPFYYLEDTIVKNNNDSLVFKNIKNKKEYKYELKSQEEILPYSLNKIIITKDEKYNYIINEKGNVIKKIKNREIENVFYNSNNKEYVIITNKINDNKKYRGSYIAK